MKILFCVCVCLFVIWNFSNGDARIQRNKRYIVSRNITKWIDSGCKCQNYSCGCCAHLDVPRIGLNDTGCVNFTYLPKEYGISFTVTIDNYTVFNETISVHNPPPLCFGAPMLKEFADLCVHFYNITISWNKAYGCVKVEARIHHVVIASYELGCFSVGHGLHHVSYNKNHQLLSRRGNRLY
ncbi:uncharacterized protein LOC106465811 [Limulus polyphemus]|uniref:Uncharacterized protein LOC106465811 n=1 Tax=Limulus polyphemus TaxID=6850 RepID=A0ABM1BGF4_LIMPO|nr:uncharacterized protein LOC106465811 [Limulus polyphemus]